MQELKGQFAIFAVMRNTFYRKCENKPGRDIIQSAKQRRAEQDKLGNNGTDQERPGQDKAVQCSTVKCNAVQVRSGQVRTDR